MIEGLEGYCWDVDMREGSCMRAGEMEGRVELALGYPNPNPKVVGEKHGRGYAHNQR
jgi:hypothetical protein